MVKWQILCNRTLVGHDWRRGPCRRFGLFGRQLCRVFLLPSPIKAPNVITMDSTPTPLSSRSTPSATLSSASFQYSEGPDEFNSDHVRYVKRSKLATKCRDGRSHIWKYGEAYIRSSDKKEVYYCYECAAASHKQKLFVLNGTGEAATYLEKKHYIDKKTGVKRTRPSVLERQRAGPLFYQSWLDRFKILLIRWIVCCYISFFQIENIYFRELLFFLSPQLIELLPKARSTIRKWIIEEFRKRKEDLKEELQLARSSISLSFDAWTSPNTYSILGVIAMWIDKDGKKRSTVLGIRRMYHEKSGENIGEVVLKLLDEYNVSGDQIGYFMLDNHGSNDSAVDHILKKLRPDMSAQQRRFRRLRCLGHVINLCCQAFLLGHDCERELAKLETHYRSGDYTQVEELWKKYGCLGRLHNLVRYIRLSAGRREEFKSIVGGGDVSEFDGLEVRYYRYTASI
jgi:hypothetical protein